MKIKRFQATVEFDVPLSMTQAQVETMVQRAIAYKASQSEAFNRVLAADVNYVNLRNIVFYTTDTENG